MNWSSQIARKAIRDSGLLLRVVVPTLFLSVFFSTALNGQVADPDSLLIFRFLKNDSEIPEPGAYFNVLEIRNNNDEPVSGLLRLGGPDGWKFIGPSLDTIILQPGGSMLFPVRISIPKNTPGGVSFVIGAELFGPDLYNYANSYISIQRKSRWDMRLSTSQVYISDFKPYGDLSIFLSNSGNSTELVKLSFDMGGLLEFREKIEADSFLFVDLPAYQDTTILFKIQRKSDLTYATEQALKGSWRSSSVNIEASTTDRLLYGSVRATPLESSIINKIPMRNSPLNTDVTMYNLLSQQRKKASVRVFGKILFPEAQQLNYSLGYYNLYFDPAMNRNIDLYQQLRYMIKYTDPRSMIWLGDRLGVGELHTLTGRGVRASHQVNDRNVVYLNVVQNPYSRNIGGFAGYGGFIGNMSWNTGLTVEATTNQTYSHSSFHLGGMYRLKQKHSIELQTATTLSKFGVSRYLDNDTTVVGVAYRLSYRYNDKRLMIRAENTNTLYSYLRNSGINRIYFTGRYLFTGKLRLHARYHRSSYASSKYPYNFYFPVNNNLNENARLLLSYNQGNITYQGGPQYLAAVRNYYYPNGDYSTRYANYQPGMMGSVSFRLGSMRSISPNLSFNTMYYSFDTGDPDEDPSELSSSWTYTLGINYYDQAFKLNAYYTTGEATDLYRSVIISDDPVINQAFHIRPYYERYFHKETIRLSVFFNYSYYMPSLRENMLINLTSNFYVRNSWNFYASFNVYRVSRKDVNVGRVTSRDVNLMLGIRKAFDIQQPRLSYYDLTIVGFNDLDGNGIKDENEKPISNVLINISRDPVRNVETRTGFAEISMITDPQGEIFYKNIPQGIYDFAISPLSNLENLYFLHGENQTIEINSDQVYYLPLVESYKIRGKIIIDRDPNSNEGIISAEGIRVTATSESGNTYSTLSNSFGTYVLDLPKANSYSVNIYNVFGENFWLKRGSYKVQFTENKTIYLDFKFIERRRAIQFNGEEQLFQFNLDNNN
ncbi:MAG: hypothetical protein KAR19_01175 [Bacteroidales bacterium]|nr:hypothetical protein [Bacteroidales bacterium]